MTKFGKYLDKQIKSIGISREQFAKDIGASRQNLWNWMNGTDMLSTWFLIVAKAISSQTKTPLDRVLLEMYESRLD